MRDSLTAWERFRRLPTRPHGRSTTLFRIVEDSSLAHKIAQMAERVGVKPTIFDYSASNSTARKYSPSRAPQAKLAACSQERALIPFFVEPMLPSLDEVRGDFLQMLDLSP